MKTDVRVEDFYPEHIFECGQCFRWNRQKDGTYTGFAFGKAVNVSFEADGKLPSAGVLTIDNCTEKDMREVWQDYFDLSQDYGVVKRKLARKDPVMKEAVKYGWGIRILKQEPWETIVSFIISANNNIPRIKKNIEDLARNFGEKKATYRGEDFYEVPSPQVLSTLTEEDLACCRLGYRAGYLIKTARSICEEGIREDRLLSYCGVGPKVADCIKLFSMEGTRCFPVDTWVKKLMHELYGLPENDKKAIEGFAREKFGENAGLAQQYLFYYMRDRTIKGAGRV